MVKLRKLLAVVLMAVAIVVISYGAFIEVDRQVVERNDYTYADGVIGLGALVVSGVFALASYLIWRWAS